MQIAGTALRLRADAAVAELAPGMELRDARHAYASGVTSRNLCLNAFLSEGLSGFARSAAALASSAAIRQ